VAAVVLFAGCAPTAERGASSAGSGVSRWGRTTGDRPSRREGVPRAHRPGGRGLVCGPPLVGGVRDPVLQRLVSDTLAGNYTCRARRQTRDGARAGGRRCLRVLIRRSDTRVQRNARRYSLFPAFPTTTFNTFTAALNVAWEIDLWGRIAAPPMAARAQVPRHRRGPAAARGDARDDVATDYFQLLELESRARHRARERRTYQRTLDVFTQRYRGGTDTKISVSARRGEPQASLRRSHPSRGKIVQGRTRSACCSAPPGADRARHAARGPVERRRRRRG